MRKILFMLGMAAVLALSLVVALAQDEPKSPGQTCKGIPAEYHDFCVVCVAQGAFTDDGSVSPVCMCKFLQVALPKLFDELFKNQGQCIKAVKSGPPVS